MKPWHWMVLMGLALTLAGCAARPKVDTTEFDPESWRAVAGWSEDAVEEAWPAWLQSCRAFMRSVKSRPTWERVCTLALTIDPRQPGAVRQYFEDNFVPKQVVVVGPNGTRDEGLVTGYYEPLLRGSRIRDDRYRFPVYAKPRDLLSIELGSLYPELVGKRLRGRVQGDKVIPYYSRAGLMQKGDMLDADVLVWLDNEVDLFFMQIQGSGRAVLDDGSQIRIGYADQNGHPYKAIGSVLIQRGELSKDNVSMQAIKKWGRENPKKLPELLNQNPSYVFFRELPEPEDPLDIEVNGPVGALGVPLLAGRTIAIDRNQLPIGAPVFVATTFANGKPLRRLTMAQDTGGAIRGALRADFYFGTGDTAGQQAGGMKQSGRFWVLMPR